MDSSRRSSSSSVEVVVGGGSGGATAVTTSSRRRSSLIVQQQQQQQQQVHSLRSSFVSSRASATLLLRSSVLLPPEVALFDLDLDNSVDRDGDISIPSSSSSSSSRFLRISSQNIPIIYVVFQCWRFILAISGLLDFISSIIAPMILQQMMDNDGGRNHTTKSVQSNNNGGLVWNVLQFLYDHDAPIAGFFHVMWMMDGFIIGYHLCKEAILENDRERLLLDDNNSGSLHQRSEPTKEGDDDGFRRCVSKSRRRHSSWSSSPWTIYITKIVCQLALLPIGFYTRILHAVVVMTMSGKRQQQLTDPNVVFQFDDNLHKSVKVSLPHIIDSNVAQEYETFTVNSKSSTAIVLLRQMFKIVSRTLHLEVTNALRSRIRMTIPRVIRIGIRHPLQSIRDAKSILRYIRLFKFLFPLILAQNRLLRYLGSSIKRLILKVLKPDKNETHDANMDSRAESKNRLSPPLRPSILQLSESQRRIRKEKELAELIAVEKQPVLQWQESDRRTLYHLHKELSEEASSWINQRLLIHPNSKFITRWRRIFIVCALFEITMTTTTTLLVGSYNNNNNNKQPQQPELQVNQHHPKTMVGKRRLIKHNSEGGMSSFQDIRPSHVSSWEVCQPDQPRKENLPAFRRWMQKVTKRWKIIRPSKNATTEQDATGVLLSSTMTPWYCHEPYASIQDTVRTIVGFIVYHMMTLVSIVCVADMYVTFFTGRYDPITGSLVVKNKLQRWIVPGIVSQLLVNPKLEGIAILASQIMTIGGPVRIWRWFVVIFFPVFHGMYEPFEQRIWLPLVAHHNQIDFELDDMLADMVIVEDASDSELEEDDDDSSAIAARNLRPSRGQWMEPVDN